MDIEKILEYQALDQIINKADIEFANSEENKRYNALCTYAKSYRDQLLKLDDETSEIYKEIDKKEAAIAAFAKDIKDCIRSLSPKNLEQAAKCDETLAVQEEKFIALEKEVTRLFKRLEEIAKEAQRAYAAFGKYNAEAVKAKALRAEKYKKILEGIKDEGVKRKQLEEVISKEDMAIYKKKRADGIRLPIVVEFKDGSCRGCGMHVQTEVQGKLVNKDDIAECPNCRRLLYRK